MRRPNPIFVRTSKAVDYISRLKGYVYCIAWDSSIILLNSVRFSGSGSQQRCVPRLGKYDRIFQEYMDFGNDTYVKKNDTYGVRTGYMSTWTRS